MISKNFFTIIFLFPQNRIIILIITFTITYSCFEIFNEAAKNSDFDSKTIREFAKAN